MSDPRIEKYDVFISYSSANLAEAALLYEALDLRKIRPWFDRRQIDSMELVTERLHEGLENCDLVVGLVSDEFLASNPCRWEALHTFMRSAREGVDRYSIVALGALPELWPAIKGIQARTWTTPDETAEWIETALRLVRARTRNPRAVPDVDPPMFQVRFSRLSNFVGRFDSLLGLYARSLTKQEDLDAGALVTRRKLAIVGLGGMGKSAIALKFAEDFARAFPGGVVWITAGGDDVRNDVTRAVDLDLVFNKLTSQVEQWVQQTAHRLELPPSPSPESAPAIERLRTVMRQATEIAENISGTILWVLDDLPSGMSQYLEEISCPSSPSVTLITARNDLSEEGFTSIGVGQLTVSEGVRLLSRARTSDAWARREAPHLAELTEAVGGHPLALEVMRARIGRGVPPGEILRELQDPQEADGVIDNDLMGVLPTGHRANIVRTLQESMIDVTEHVAAAATVLCLLAVTLPEPDVWRNLIAQTLTASGAGRANDVVGELIHYGLLIDDDPPEVEPAQRTVQVHAITRMVARALLNHREAPLTASGAEVRAVADAAAQWFHDRGAELRNGDDIGAVRWFERSLFSLAEYMEDPSAAERVLLAASWRGIGRAEFRAPIDPELDPLAPESPTWLRALELAERAERCVEQGLEAEPTNQELLLARAQALALRGIVLDGRSDRLRRGGYLREALEVNDQATAMVREQIDVREARALVIESHSSGADFAKVRLAQADAARSWMNLPGRLIGRAKLLRELARVEGADDAGPAAIRSLAEAAEIYSRIGQRREEIFAPATRTTSDYLEIAACAYGQGLVPYVRGALFTSSVSERTGLLVAAAEPLARSTRLRMAADNERDTSKCIALAAKIGLALRALSEGSVEVPWDDWLAFGRDLRTLTPEVDVTGAEADDRPEPEALPADFAALLALATAPQRGDRDDGRRRRDAAALAALDALDRLAGASATIPDANQAAHAGVPTSADDLALASLTWLTLVQLLGVPRAQRVEHVRRDWLEEGPDWLPTRT